MMGDPNDRSDRLLEVLRELVALSTTSGPPKQEPAKPPVDDQDGSDCEPSESSESIKF